MLQRLPLLLSLFGGLNPVNVWEMAYEEFLILADVCDARLAEMKAVKRARR